MIKKIIPPLYGIAMVLILWWGLSFAIGSNMVPTPYDTLKELVELFQQDFLFHIIYSFYRIISSVTMSLLIGIPVGILLGVNKYIDKIVSPITYLLYPIPKIILMITIIIFQIIIVTKDGVKEIDKDILISAKVMHFNWIDMIIKVILPAILPKVFSALRVSIGIAISALFFSENYATRYGLGYFIMNSWSMVDYKGMFAGVLALSIMSLIIFKIIDYLEKKICLWNS